MQSSARISVQQILVHLVIGVVLIAAVVAVIFWAKSRSEQYAASDQTEQGAEEIVNTDETFSEDEPTTEDQDVEVTFVEDEEDEANEEPTATGNTAETPPSVPSTGPGDYLLSIGALSAFAFAGLKYSQSRRRLMTLQ